MQLTIVAPHAWNAEIARLPQPHLLQTWEWAQVKARVGWRPYLYLWREPGGLPAAAALALRRSLPLAGFAARLAIVYVPKGPLLADWGDLSLRGRVLDDLTGLAKRQGALLLKIDPDVPLGTGVPGGPDEAPDPLGQVVTADLLSRGWRYSESQVQFRNTALIDLRPEEDALLAGMKQKTRYNLRLAERKGVRVRPGGLSDLERLYRMYAHTSVRDGFVIREREYYLHTWQTFIQAGMAEPLIAEVDGQAVAGVVIFRFGGRAYYLQGMSLDEHREKMPNVLLQWEAMRRARAAGCTVYDLWGAPEVFDESDPLWGVFRFKRGLGAQVLRTLGAWDLPLRPFFYQLYTHTLPRLLDWMRRRGRQRARLDAGM